MRDSNPLRLADGPILVTQLQLLLGNLGSSVVPGLATISLLLITLHNDSNTLPLLTWAAMAFLPRWFLAWHGRRMVLAGISPEHAPRLVWRLVLFHVAHGAIWGSLAWLTLDTASVGGVALVVALLAALAGSSVSLFSPILPVYLVFSTIVLLMLATKLWFMDDTSYRPLAGIAILYLPMLFMQARNSAAATRAAIVLRSEHRQLIARLEVETENAKQANLAKSRFLAEASHDLRQPLHAVNLFVEALRHERDPGRIETMVDQLRASTHALEGLLTELLDMAKLEAGLFKPRVRPFPLQEMMDALGREFRPLADEKGIELGFVPTRAWVESDPLMLGRILRNLISNSIRYTERGAVLVGCRRKGDRVTVVVCDTGPGIPEEHHQAVFREFYQLGNPERDRRKGLGLGLAIVDGLCRVLHHPLQLRSRVGRGTTISVTVPLVHATQVEPDPVPEDVRVDLEGTAVLVIDDDPTICRAMAEVLTRWGCAVLTAESADQALKRMDTEAFVPDVMLADYRLRDGITGNEAIAEIRSRLGTPIPAALLTGDTAPERLRDASASGLLLLHKPVQPTRLYAALAELRYATTHGQVCP